MATKKAPIAFAPGRWAPDPGEDTEFDDVWEKVKSTLTSGSETFTDEEMDERRELLARRLVEQGGKSFKPGRGITTEPIPDEPEEPESSVELTIPPRPVDPYWYDDPRDALLFEHYVMARRALGNALHGALLITGPAGQGKTMGVPQAIKRINERHGLSIRLFKMNCPTVTDPGKWFGRREVDADGTRFIKSDFVEAVERGDVILLDEIARLHPNIHNPIMSLLDGTEEVTLSDLNVTIRRHPQTAFIATTNIGVQYGGTHRMDWAMRERFPFTIERGVPPEEDEIRILSTHTNCPADKAKRLVAIADNTRRMFAAGDLRSAISTRTLVAAAWLVASGMPERDALEVTALPLFDGDASGIVGAESDRQKVGSAVEGKLGRRR